MNLTFAIMLLNKNKIFKLNQTFYCRITKRTLEGAWQTLKPATQDEEFIHNELLAFEGKYIFLSFFLQKRGGAWEWGLGVGLFGEWGIRKNLLEVQ